MPDNGLAVEFFGARGSYPVTGTNFARFGGNTASLCIHVGGKRLLLDGGLGLIPLGRRVAEIDREHLIFLSHLHYDHLTGLPFFAPLFQPHHRVRVYAPAQMVAPLRVFWGRPYFPLDLASYQAQVELLPIPEGKIDLARLLNLPDPTGNPIMETLFLGSQCHPSDGVMIFRITSGGKRIVYATDIELGSKLESKLESSQAHHQVTQFCAGADLLICDSQFNDSEYQSITRGWGHNSASMAIGLARSAAVHRLILFHHSPDRDDAGIQQLEEEARAQFPQVEAAYEGMLLQL